MDFKTHAKILYLHSKKKPIVQAFNSWFPKYENSHLEDLFKELRIPTLQSTDHSSMQTIISFFSANDLLDEDLKIPFACLKSLDLSYNQISEEESLLAVTSWPLLHELKLWGNPLTRSSKGIPHVLHHHLKVMCGIDIVRYARFHIGILF